MESLSNRAKRDRACREKPPVADYLPTELTIAATDRCNLRCVMCGTHHAQNGDNNVGKFDFPKELIGKFAGATAGAERIQLHGGGGEPMMSRSFWKWISLFSDSAQIEFNTNGLLLSPRNIDRLMKQRVGYINISCDAATEETYRKIRGSDWNRLVRNIAMLAKARSQLRPDIHLRLNMTVMRDNAHEMADLVRMASQHQIEEVEFFKLNDGPEYRWLEHTRHGYTFDYQSNLPENNVVYIRPFLREATRVGQELGVGLEIDRRLFAALSLTPPQSGPAQSTEYSSCDSPWRWLNVSATGDVFPCCSATKPLGNLNDVGTLAEIWNGDVMRRLRRNIRGNEIDPICKGGSCVFMSAHQEASSGPRPTPIRTEVLRPIWHFFLIPLWRRLVPQFAKPALRNLLKPLLLARATQGNIAAEPAVSPGTPPPPIPAALRQLDAQSLAIQQRIDAVNWYHEFDFGNGLAAKSKSTDIEDHRKFWNHIRTTLDTIDFAGKSVLDIGCWDGYWSFYAEQRGAARVVASDDCNQNWAGDTGLKLAKELLHSAVEINSALSVYDLRSLNQKFDVIMCLGVYYHLVDPFYAFAQIRHCCHDQTVVVFEGDVRSQEGLPPGAALNYFNESDGAVGRFRPTPATLSGLLETAYLQVETQSLLVPWDPPSVVHRSLFNRIVLTCKPFRGENRCFWYRPPFGLDRYDTRWAHLSSIR